jgi:hypothetical protein
MATDITTDPQAESAEDLAARFAKSRSRRIES